MRKLFATGVIWMWIGFVVFMADHFSKLWIVDHLRPYDPLYVTSFFDLTLSYNTGAAFSFLNNASGWQNMLFINLAYAACIFIIYWLYKLPANARWMSIALSLICGGAFGNAWDRMSYGYVVDFLHFHLFEWHFAIFNVADSAICVGAFMLIMRWRDLSK